MTTTHHYADHRDELSCPDCKGSRRLVDRLECEACADTGCRGGEKREITIAQYEGLMHDGKWKWYLTEPGNPSHGPFEAKADALFAARCAYHGVTVYEDANEDGYSAGWVWGYFPENPKHHATGVTTTRDAALEAAIDTKRGKNG